MLSAVQVFSRVPTKIESEFDMLSIFGVSVLLLRELDSSRHIQDVTVVLSTRDSGVKLKSSFKLELHRKANHRAPRIIFKVIYDKYAAGWIFPEPSRSIYQQWFHKIFDMPRQHWMK